MPIDLGAEAAKLEQRVDKRWRPTVLAIRLSAWQYPGTWDSTADGTIMDMECAAKG